MCSMLDICVRAHVGNVSNYSISFMPLAKFIKNTYMCRRGGFFSSACVFILISNCFIHILNGNCLGLDYYVSCAVVLYTVWCVQAHTCTYEQVYIYRAVHCTFYCHCLRPIVDFLAAYMPSCRAAKPIVTFGFC